MPDWAGWAKAALADGPTAMVSVLATSGSAPRPAGTRMIVTAGAFSGTIGGGRLELQALAQARAILDHPPGTWRAQDYPLGPLLGQCCGGRVHLLVERLDPAATAWLDGAIHGALLVTHFGANTLSREVLRFNSVPPAGSIAARPAPGAQIYERLGPPARRVLLFGAGHVGRAIARACAGLPFDLQWFDTRAEWAATPGAVLVGEEDAVALAGEARAEAAIAILTHDHALDYRLAAAALAGEAGFVGMIGSATKRARLLSRLEKDGVSSARLTCPIGLPQVPGKSPEAIAIATVAQLLALGEPA